MKLLVKKEFTFTALPLCYLFLGFSLLTLVPGYPIAVGSFFLCLGLFQSLLSRREQGDLSYTLLLPVSKREIVKANYLFTVLLQLAYGLLCALLTALRVLCFFRCSGLLAKSHDERQSRLSGVSAAGLSPF